MVASSFEPIQFFVIAHFFEKLHNLEMSLLSGISKVCVPAPAKINLFLSVGEKRADDFHELRTVLAKVQLHDLVTIRKTERQGSTTISCPGNIEIANEQNLAVQIVNYWRAVTGGWKPCRCMRQTAFGTHTTPKSSSMVHRRPEWSKSRLRAVQ